MNHTRLVCFLLAVLFMLAAVFAACEPGEGSGDVTGGVKDKTSNPYADDDTVYNTECFAGDCVYFNQIDAGGGGSHLVFTLLDYPGDMYHACPDPTCDHRVGSDCPFVGGSVLCVVMRDGRLPVLYITSSLEVSEFDTETGALRWVGNIPVGIGARGADDAWFYRGKLYMYTNFCKEPGRARARIAVLDTVKKRSEYFDSDVGTGMLGIWGDRVWYITDRNVICSCALDFSDVREEYDVGIEEKNYRVNRHTLGGFIDSGVIYFERNCREPEKFAGDAFINESGDGYDLMYEMVSDVYMLDADDIGAGERLVAEGVIQFKTHNGDLYYTKMDYDHYEESETYTYTVDKGEEFESSGSGKTYRFDGGTLYRYEHESGKTVTVCEDIGTNFSVVKNHISTVSMDGIIEVTDDYVFFSGRQYRDLDDELKDRDCCNYICQLDIKTGQWRVLVERADVPWGSVS